MDKNIHIVNIFKCAPESVEFSATSVIGFLRIKQDNRKNLYSIITNFVFIWDQRFDSGSQIHASLAILTDLGSYLCCSCLDFFKQLSGSTMAETE